MKTRIIIMSNKEIRENPLSSRTRIIKKEIRMKCSFKKKRVE
jgi:hypothetical protein